MAKFEAHLKCSFCGKSQEQVRKLIAGPGVYICDECIDLCNEILDEELLESPGKTKTGNDTKIAEDTERDHFLSPQDAVEYGLIDQVVNCL